MNDLYELWRRQAEEDPDIVRELLEMEGEPEKIEEAFYSDLSFGTGGMRSTIGAGTNRLNIYTVGKASQGVANYIKRTMPEELWSIAVSFDSRIKSELFARTTAQVCAANGIHVYIYPELMPTPCLSFVVRYLKCGAGVMITASHNPAEYNGYKVYGPDGCQIATERTAAISAEIEKLDIFRDPRKMDFDQGVSQGLITWIEDQAETAFIEAIKAQSVLGGEKVCKDISIVYTPLNGTGLKPVMRSLTESGYTNIHVVKEQEEPDGTFPTCPYPNPEVKEAMELGIRYAKDCKAELLMATDPDCDRVGIAVPGPDGEYVLLSGNETGILLLDYICARRTAMGTMPEDPVAAKTIVTTDMAERIAAHYGVRMVNVLTGFKYIGEYMGKLEAEGKEDSFIFGLEESYGYLSGSYVRDKDGVNAAYLICEMVAYYKKQGICLYDRLQELYQTYGYCLNGSHSYYFKGRAGKRKMSRIMDTFRGRKGEIGGKKILEMLDYAEGIDGLPKSNVLKFILEDNCCVIIRPSGTEPKLKVYIFVSAGERDILPALEQQISRGIEDVIHG